MLKKNLRISHRKAAILLIFYTIRLKNLTAHDKIMYSKKTNILLPLTVALFLFTPIFDVFLIFLGLNSGFKFGDWAAYYQAPLRYFADAPVYSIEPELFVEQLKNYYNKELTDIVLPYVYPPIMLIFFYPFTFIPFKLSFYLFNLISVLFLCYSVVYLVRSFNRNLSQRDTMWLSVAVISFSPVLRAVQLGQVSTILAGLLCFVVAARNVSSVPAVLVSIPKPYYLPVALYTIQNKKRFFSFVGGIAGAAISSVALLGTKIHIEYVLYVLNRTTRSSHSVEENVWHQATFRPLATFHEIGIPVMLIKIFLFISMVFISILYKKYHDDDEDDYIEVYIVCLGICSIPLLTPEPELLILCSMIPVIISMVVIESEKNSGRVIFPLASAILIQIHPYSIEFVSGFAGRVFPSLDPIFVVVYKMLPIIQPALIGVLLLYTFLWYQVLSVFTYDSMRSLLILQSE